MADRLVRVEEKIAFIDHQLQSLDIVVREQADRIDRLERQIARLVQEWPREQATEQAPKGESEESLSDQPNE